MDLLVKDEPDVVVVVVPPEGAPVPLLGGGVLVSPSSAGSISVKDLLSEVDSDVFSVSRVFP
ncbi:MAG: hypothetical protein QM518_12830, partial [Verrucomicrobiota bacterium]|nr:hypothetical protein [Verrucomicrobiota bacterium]